MNSHSRFLQKSMVRQFDNLRRELPKRDLSRIAIPFELKVRWRLIFRRVYDRTFQVLTFPSILKAASSPIRRSRL